eukprot:4884241-Lingulodinium_polyedra.AAC.1
MRGAGEQEGSTASDRSDARLEEEGSRSKDVCPQKPAAAREKPPCGLRARAARRPGPRGLRESLAERP